MQKIPRICINALLLFLTLHSGAQQVAKRIPYRASPEGIIGFLEFRPADYGSQHHPLIIFLHGTDERGSGRPSEIQSVAINGIPRLCASGASMQFTVNKQTSSFVVLSPQLSKQYGAWQPFYIKEMIDYAKKNLDIDTNRIYVTGLSLGGGGVWSAITYTAGLTRSIAAAAPVCGTQDMTDSNFCSIIGATHLPIWAFHSVDDRSVPVQATEHAEVLGNICKLTPSIKISYYQAGGHVRTWLNAYDTGHVRVLLKGGVKPAPGPNLYEWFLQHTLLNKTHSGAAKSISSKKKKK